LPVRRLSFTGSAATLSQKAFIGLEKTSIIKKDIPTKEYFNNLLFIAARFPNPLKRKKLNHITKSAFASLPEKKTRLN
jgi:hypothetical protein